MDGTNTNPFFEKYQADLKSIKAKYEKKNVEKNRKLREEFMNIMEKREKEAAEDRSALWEEVETIGKELVSALSRQEQQPAAIEKSSSHGAMRDLSGQYSQTAPCSNTSSTLNSSLANREGSVAKSAISPPVNGSLANRQVSAGRNTSSIPPHECTPRAVNSDDLENTVEYVDTASSIGQEINEKIISESKKIDEITTNSVLKEKVVRKEMQDLSGQCSETAPCSNTSSALNGSLPNRENSVAESAMSPPVNSSLVNRDLSVAENSSSLSPRKCTPCPIDSDDLENAVESVDIVSSIGSGIIEKLTSNSGRIGEITANLLILKGKIERKEMRDLRDFCEQTRKTIDMEQIEIDFSDYQKEMHASFTEIAGPIMKKFGYCCSESPYLAIRTVECKGDKSRRCYIDPGQMMFNCKRDDAKYLEYCICEEHFEALRDQPSIVISFSERYKEDESHEVGQFERIRNDGRLEKEALRECDKCSKLMHVQCEFFFSMEKKNVFQCERCRKAAGEQSYRDIHRDNFMAKQLRETECSKFIEERVIKIIEQWKNEHSGIDVEPVYIRMLCDREELRATSSALRFKYPEENKKMRIRSKGIYLFQRTEGEEACLFALRTQEVTDKGLESMQRTATIAYLDSVHFFQPRELRSLVYQEIIISYLAYIKKRGYHKVHVWAEPPQRGQDYIFAFHPLRQLIPDRLRLKKWYYTWQDKAVDLGIIKDYKTIAQYIAEKKIVTPKDLPYFPGGLWSEVLSELIGNDGTPDERQEENKLQNVPDDQLLEKMCENNASDCHFVINLVTDTGMLENDIEKDDEDVFYGKMWQSRDGFLDLAYESSHQLEFSSLRRAQYATMAMLKRVWAYAGKKDESVKEKKRPAADSSSTEPKKKRRGWNLKKNLR